MAGSNDNSYNSGFYNLGSVEAYPTGGTGPTAYGPTSYYGSDPRPAQRGDSLYNAIDGTFTAVFRSVPLTSNAADCLGSKRLYKIRLTSPRSIQFTQELTIQLPAKHKQEHPPSYISAFPTTGEKSSPSTTWAMSALKAQRLQRGEFTFRGLSKHA